MINQSKLYWTEHAKKKMRQYRLSEGRLKRVLRHPGRLEVGVARNTLAGMQTSGSKKHPYEIWVMWQRKPKTKNSKFKNKFKDEKTIIISAWKYPGTSPVHEPPPIPEDTWETVRKSKYISEACY